MATALGRIKRQGGSETGSRVVTYRLPTALKNALQEAVVRDRYGLKGKSRWLNEAIVGFLQERSWRDQALDGDMNCGNDEKDVLQCNEETRAVLADAKVQLEQYLEESATTGIRSDAPESTEVTTSAIVRAAIVWRLFSLSMPKFKA